jgi:phage-related protein
LEDGIYELRIKVLKKQLRILFFFSEHKISISHGFVKKTKEVPQIEIKKVKQYREDFLSRGG